MTAPTPDQAAAQIEHALKLGPTPGPWTTISRATYHWEEEADLLDADGNDIESAEFVKPIGDVPTTRGQMYMRDAVYITKVSPDRLRLLLDERRALIDTVAELRAAEAARRELLARQVPDPRLAILATFAYEVMTCVYDDCAPGAAEDALKATGLTSLEAIVNLAAPAAAGAEEEKHG